MFFYQILQNKKCNTFVVFGSRTQLFNIIFITINLTSFSYLENYSIIIIIFHIRYTISDILLLHNSIVQLTFKSFNLPIG